MPTERSLAMTLEGLTLDPVVRVSRRNGRGEDGEEWSPDRQRETIIRDAAHQKATLGVWWDESDSVSGGSVDRDGLNAAVERALAGETDGIIVAKMDRFARTVVGGLNVIARLHAAGKYLYSVKEGMMVGPSKPTAMEKLLRTFFLMLAEWQRDSATEEWESIKRRQIERGINNGEPYGYRKGEDRRLELEPAEAPVVLRIYKLRADGGKSGSWSAIADALNAEGIKPRSNPGQRKSNGWTASRVKSLVENRVYLGEVRSGDFVKVNAHPAIVSEALWNRANGRRDSAGRKEGRDYLLAGLIYCAGCGVKMVGNSSTGRDGVTEYLTYRCRRNHPFGKCPEPANVNAPEVEAAVMEDFASRYFGITLEGAQDTSAFDNATAEDEAVAEMIRTYASDPANQRLRMEEPTIYQDGLSALLNRRKETRAAVNEERNRALKVEFPENLEELWSTLPVDRRRRYLAQAYDLVAVRRGTGVPFGSRGHIFQRDTAPVGIIGRALDGVRPIDF